MIQRILETDAENEMSLLETDAENWPENSLFLLLSHPA
jgi:hypothetical protein